MRFAPGTAFKFSARYMHSSAQFSGSVRFANSAKFLGTVKVKFKRFGILKFCEGEREQSKQAE